MSRWHTDDIPRVWLAVVADIPPSLPLSSASTSLSVTDTDETTKGTQY